MSKYLVKLVGRNAFLIRGHTLSGGRSWNYTRCPAVIRSIQRAMIINGLSLNTYQIENIGFSQSWSHASTTPQLNFDHCLYRELIECLSPLMHRVRSPYSTVDNIRNY